MFENVREIRKNKRTYMRYTRILSRYSTSISILRIIYLDNRYVNMPCFRIRAKVMLSQTNEGRRSVEKFSKRRLVETISKRFRRLNLQGDQDAMRCREHMPGRDQSAATFEE